MILNVISHSLFTTLQDNANYTGMAARDTAHALKVLTQGIRGIVTSPHTSRPLREKLLNCAYDVMVKSGELINEAKNAINHPNDPENKARLAQVCCVHRKLEINKSSSYHCPENVIHYKDNKNRILVL